MSDRKIDESCLSVMCYYKIRYSDNFFLYFFICFLVGVMVMWGVLYVRDVWGFCGDWRVEFEGYIVFSWMDC